MTSYLSDEGGNIAVVTALTLGLLAMGVGGAIDFNNANHSKSQLQAAIDAGVLAAVMDESMKGVENGQTGDAKKIIEDVATQNLPEGFRFKVNVRVKDKMLHAEADHDHTTSLLQIIGMKQLGVTVDSAAYILDDIPVHIALVVDTTQSMDGANMTALKSAANALLDDIDAFSDNAKVSLVPYGQYVNIGTEYEFAPWMDTTRRIETKTRSWDAGCRDKREVLEPRTCTNTGATRQEPIYNDGAITGYRTVNEQTCTDTVYGSNTTQECWDAGTSTTTINYTFTGCAASRPSPKNLIPGASSADRIRGAMQPDNATWKVQCGAKLIPLTDQISKIRTTLNALTTSGETYLPSGLMWGWRTLDPSVPFTEAQGADPKTVRAIILMTDGGNTINQKSESSDDPGYHYDKGSWGDNGRDLFDSMCTKVKDDGILVFTIGYNLDSSFPRHSESVTSLSSCATSNGHAYTPDNVNELKDAFEAVMLSIRDIRLAI